MSNNIVDAMHDPLSEVICSFRLINVGETPDKEATLALISYVLHAAGFEGYLASDKSIHPCAKFPYSATDEHGEAAPFASSWLACLINFVRTRLSRGVGPEGIAVEVLHEIVGRPPMLPVRLNREGDTLVGKPVWPTLWCESPLDLDFFRRVPSETDPLQQKEVVGVHRYCDGTVRRWRSSPAQDVLVCERCFLRVLFDRRVVSAFHLRNDIRRRIIGLSPPEKGPERVPYACGETRPSVEV